MEHMNSIDIESEFQRIRSERRARNKKLSTIFVALGFVLMIFIISYLWYKFD